MTPEIGPYSAEIGFEEPTSWQDHKRSEDRLWLAGMAMQALIRDEREMRMIAEQAWALADAMLEEELK
jgi:hypothetical protein